MFLIPTGLTTLYNSLQIYKIYLIYPNVYSF